MTPPLPCVTYNAMAGYTKLHSTILDSSVWAESIATRIVWITMLAMADQNGVVQASAGGLARRANVTREECDEALAVFLGPDPDSRDGTTGERIEKVPGGWLVLNHANYRDKQTREQEQTALRVARHRAKQSVTCNDVTDGNTVKRVTASASAPLHSASEEREPKPARRVGAEDPRFSEFWLAYDFKKNCPAAYRAWVKIQPDDGLAVKIVAKAREVRAANPTKEFSQYPSTWLNARGWEDDIVPRRSTGRPVVAANGRPVVEASKMHIPNMPLGSEFCDCPGCAAAKLTRSLSDAKNVSNHVRGAS